MPGVGRVVGIDASKAPGKIFREATYGKQYIKNRLKHPVVLFLSGDDTTQGEKIKILNFLFHLPRKEIFCFTFR